MVLFTVSVLSRRLGLSQGHKRHLGFFRFSLLVSRHERRYRSGESQHRFLKHQKEMKRKGEAAPKMARRHGKVRKTRGR